MIVIADTSPINYLVLIEHIDVLHELYGRVVIPNAVYAELQDERAPQAVKEWVKNHPPWLEVRLVSGSMDETLEDFGPGEREAIQLAEQLRADAVILDELNGRKAAVQRKLRVTGTVGVLDEAAEIALLNFPEAIKRLRLTNFREPRKLVEKLLRKYEKE